MATKKQYYSHAQKQPKGWSSDKPSMTVMGESWTIRELVDKYASGQIQPDANVSYLDVENFDAITEVFRKHIDLTDLDNFTRQIKTLQATGEAQLAEQEEPITEEVSFKHPKYVTATFQAQLASFACQGNWATQIVSIPKNEYSIEKLQEKVEREFNVYFY